MSKADGTDSKRIRLDTLMKAHTRATTATVVWSHSFTLPHSHKEALGLFLEYGFTVSIASYTVGFQQVERIWVVTRGRGVKLAAPKLAASGPPLAEVH